MACVSLWSSYANAARPSNSSSESSWSCLTSFSLETIFTSFSLHTYAMERVKNIDSFSVITW